MVERAARSAGFDMKIHPHMLVAATDPAVLFRTGLIEALNY
jgi:hypothetical protein